MSGGHPVQNLLRWLKTFDAASAVESVNDIADGIILGKVLLAISPKHFSHEWLSHLKTGGQLSFSVKVENLQYIVRAVEAFLAQVPDESIVVRPLPDLVLIAKYNSEDEAFRLLQLVLVCAVNCDYKVTYIEAIMYMEESVQQVLMEAIQQLMSASSTRLSATSDLFQDSGDSHLLTTADECKHMAVQKEALTQRCHDLEKLVATLRGENANLQLELERALRTPKQQLVVGTSELDGPANLLPGTGLSDPTAQIPMSPTVASVRIGQLQDQLTKLRNELYRVETEKEELKIKLVDSQTAADGLRQKCELLARKSEEAVHLKDELDIAREELAAASHLTTSMEQLRKRADEAVELRVRCAKLETDNRVLIDRVAELEQETRLSGNVRSQAETQRLQAADARQAATQANARADAIESELRRVRDELSATMREKTRLVTELNRLRTCCEQLQRCAPPAHGLEEELQSMDSEASGMVYTPAMQSQMLNLREELTRLRTSLSSVEIAASASMVDENHAMTLSESDAGRLMHTSDFLETSSNAAVDPHHESDHASSPGQISAAKSEDHQLLASLREQLAEKDRAYEQMEQKYRGYLWKARGLVRSLQRQLRTQAETVETVGQESSDMTRLRALLVEKERIIENLEHHLEQTRLRRDAEERILLAAWYNRGVRQTRELVEQRIRDRQAQSKPPGSHPRTTLDDGPLVTGAEDVSFLERQREMHLKPPRGLTSVVMVSK